MLDTASIVKEVKNHKIWRKAQKQQVLINYFEIHCKFDS